MAGAFGNETNPIMPLVSGALGDIRNLRAEKNARLHQDVGGLGWAAPIAKTRAYKARNPLVGALHGSMTNYFNPETQQKVKMSKAAREIKDWMKTEGLDPVKDQEKILEKTANVATDLGLMEISEKATAKLAEIQSTKLDMETKGAQLEAIKNPTPEYGYEKAKVGDQEMMFPTINGQIVGGPVTAGDAFRKPDVNKAGDLTVQLPKEMSKADTDYYSELRNEAKVGQDVVDQIDVMDAALGDLQTNRFSNWKIWGGEVAASLGFDWKAGEIARLQAAKNASGELVMKVLGRFKGAISNAEREFVAGMMPQITNTRAAREFASEALRVTADRAALKRDMAARFMRTHKDLLGTDKSGTFDEQWDKYRKENPLLTQLETIAEKYKSVPPEQGQPPKDPYADVSDEELKKRLKEKGIIK